MFKHILVPTDGSKLSLKALDAAASLALLSKAKLTVVTISGTYPNMVGGDGYLLATITPREWEAGLAKRAAGIQREVEKRLAKSKIVPGFVAVTIDEVHVGILDTAKRRKCDLIVMASHGRRGLSALLMGSETNKVLTHSKLPVLVCR